MIILSIAWLIIVGTVQSIKEVQKFNFQSPLTIQYSIKYCNWQQNVRQARIPILIERDTDEKSLILFTMEINFNLPAARMDCVA